MNEDKLLILLSSLDDDLEEQEIEKIMEGVDCNMESVREKALQKLGKHNKKANLKRRLSYVAAVCVCFIGFNAVVYADEISETIKTFFNKTPVYSTMVDGSAYYLPERLVLDDDMAIDSFMVSEGRMEMEFTSRLSEEVLCDMKIVPQNDPDALYVMGGYSEEGDNKYSFLLMNGKEKDDSIKPFNKFDMIVGDKTYSVALEKAQSLDGTQKLSESEPAANQTGLVSIGANSIEKDGQQAVQLIASFKNKDMKLNAFGEPVDKTFESTVENRGKDGIVSHSSGARTEAIYATDEKGIKHKLEKPLDAKAFPVTTFMTGAAQGSKLSIQLPALTATYPKKVDSLSINIPGQGEETLNREFDLIAQKAVLKSVTRLSPTTAKLVFQLNTGAEKNVKIRSFNMYSQGVKKISSEFSGDTAVTTLEFQNNINTANLDISWPEFVMNGNWTINLK
ncbi:MAG: hypothetical protein ABFD08_17535 [Syntrophomonas sp.]